MNSDINKLHKQLIKTHQKLSTQLGKTKNQEDAESIYNEMMEVHHRVGMAGRLLFKKFSAEIAKDTDPVVKACSELDESMKKIEKISDLIKDVAKALTKVDDVLDKLKLSII